MRSFAEKSLNFFGDLALFFAGFLALGGFSLKEADPRINDAVFLSTSLVLIGVFMHIGSRKMKPKTPAST